MAFSEFAIHPIDVGGGLLAIAPMPGRGLSYAADLSTVFAWAPALVISMTEQAEMDVKGAGRLGADLADAGMLWCHLPVVDFGTPVDLDWPAVRNQALGALGRGERVLVHCFGGCGRSGMIILRLMIAAGEAPQAALLRLRNIRPCAVETKAQMDWAWQG